MRYFLAILIMGAGFWYWMQPRGDVGFTGAHGNTMGEAEKAYYIQMFNHAMSHVHDGQRYAWESYNSKGAFKPSNTYASKSKSLCRRFTEDYTIGQHSGTQEGVTCKRKGKAGWCRLKIGDAETCAMERSNPALMFGNLNMGRVDLGTIKLGGMELSIPTTDLDVGGIGSADTPDGPDGEGMDFLPDDPSKRKSNIDWLTN